MGSLWKKIDLLEDPPVYLEITDECYYAREYHAHGGYQASEANQLISNFKKSMDRKDKPEFYYKKKAIKQFARELADVIPKGMMVAPIPTSRRLDDPLHDPRLILTVKQLQEIRPDIQTEVPFLTATSREALHTQTTRSSIADVYNSLEWKGIEKPHSSIAIIDDLITCGTSFRACCRMISEHHPEMQVIGFFWARSIWPDSE